MIFIVLIVFILLVQKINLNLIKKYVKNKVFWVIVMSLETDKILKFIQYMRPDKKPCTVFTDIESLIRKIDGCANNPENSSRTKVGEHIPSGYSMSTISSLDHIEKKHILYRGNDCVKKFCTSLREHTKNVIDFEKKKMLTKEELKSHQGTKE